MKLQKKFPEILLYMCLLSSAFGDVRVRYVAIIFRHGERTPVEPYPLDPWRNESLWPERFGQLTNIGKRQHFALGRWIRQRYSSLMPKNYDPKELYVQSTDVDRTLMSAQANLAGMYPPTGKSIWNRDLDWQPIPVHTVPEKFDEVLAMSRKCPAYDRAYAKMINSNSYKERLSRYHDLMEYLTTYSGRLVKDYVDILDIYSTLFIETLNHFKLPNWTHVVYPDQMKEPGCYSFVTQTGTAYLAKIKVAPLLKAIVRNMHNAIEKTRANATDYLKMSMYSGHDLTIGNILNAMNVFDLNCPVFTATIIMELVQDTAHDIFFVRLLYRNSTEIVAPYVLRMPFCKEYCPMVYFENNYKDLLDFDWDAECKDKPQIRLLTLLIIFLFCLSAFLVCLNLHLAPKPFVVVV